MVLAAGQSMAKLSSTYPRYRTSTSNRHSKVVAGTLACAIPVCLPTRAKLALADPFLTRHLSGPAAQKRLPEGDAKQPVSMPGGLPTAWLYSATSAAVASFLHGPAMLPDNFGEEPRRPAVGRPRLDLSPSTMTASSQPRVDESVRSHSDNSPFSLVSGFGSSSGTSALPSAFSSSPASGWGTHATTPELSRSPHSDSGVSAPPPTSPFVGAEPPGTASSRPDPFAYIDSAESPKLGVSPPMSSGPTTNWGSDVALLEHPLFARDVPPHLTRPVPPHAYAYVSLGAGANQNDVDVFTAAHPLDGGVVPYHIPLCVYLP